MPLLEMVVEDTSHRRYAEPTRRGTLKSLGIVQSNLQNITRVDCHLQVLDKTLDGKIQVEIAR